jgi:large repetitive protein
VKVLTKLLVVVAVAALAGLVASPALAQTVTGVSPAVGPVAGGQAVTIDGSGFTGATEVDFGAGNPAAIQTVTDSEVTVTSPTGTAGQTVDVTVTTPDGTSPVTTADQYTYATTPTVTAVAPSVGPLAGGNQVTITGTGFVTGQTTVDFGLVAAAAVVDSYNTITATAPMSPSAATVDVTVTNPIGTSATSAADQYTYDPVPTVTSLNPNTGPLAGGATVTIAGSGFVSDATTVKFGSSSGTGVTVTSASSLTVTSPAGSGTVGVTVTTPGGTSSAGTSAQMYTYEALPAVTGVSPGDGPASGGGTAVTITGTGFTGATAVDFGAGNPAATFTVVNDGKITTTSPAGTAGTVDVTVTTGNGTSQPDSADKFTYDPIPTVTAVSPAAGPLAGGTSVTITGTGFLVGEPTTVKFGTATATSVTVVSGSSITARAPAGSGTVDVTVTTTGGTSAANPPGDDFTYDPVPTVTGVGPAAGPLAGGTPITISGTGFTSGATVTVGGAAATGVNFVNSGTITATTPASGSTGTVDVRVTTLGGQSATSSADQFTYDPVPAVTGVSPAAGPLSPGTGITISGSNFLSGSTVTVGGVAATGVHVVNSGTITATTPTSGSAGTVDVRVTTAGGQSPVSAADEFTYDPVPTVTGLSKPGGPLAGGTPVTITGTGFVTGATVAFGSGAGAGVDVVNSTTITVTSPSGAAGEVPVIVTTPGGSSSDTGPATEFTYTDGPLVDSVDPAAGPLVGGTSVTITGTNLGGATAVSFGSTPATTFTDTSGTITATTPAEVAGTVYVVVTTSGGTSPSTGGGNLFSFDPVPTVTAVSPSGGPLAGGTAITITGTGFAAPATVSVGGVAASAVSVVDPTTITATTPAGAAGAVDVEVTTPGGSSPANPPGDDFSYDRVPTVTGVSPGAGSTAGGTSVTITGTDFVAGATTVSFGSRAGTSVSVASPTSLKVKSPAGSGTVPVTVTTPGGTSTAATGDSFTYVVPPAAPAISGISPVGGPFGGGTQITISGANLAGATGVAFGSRPAASFSVASASEIHAVSPAGAPGTVEVTVTTPGGTSATVTAGRFTYAGAPVLSVRSAIALAPQHGTVRGTVDPDGLPVASCRFQYGTTVHYGRTAQCSVPIGSLLGPIAVHAVLTHLEPATKYYYRLVASTLAGTTRGPRSSFVTPQLPLVGAPLVGLLVERVHHGARIGKLLGISGIIDAQVGETIVMRCVAACERRVALRVAVRNARAAKRKVRLKHALFLSRKTRIEIDVSAGGELGRFAEYAFKPAGGSLKVKITAIGCGVGSSKPVKCPRGKSRTAPDLVVAGPRVAPG